MEIYEKIWLGNNRIIHDYLSLLQLRSRQFCRENYSGTSIELIMDKRMPNTIALSLEQDQVSMMHKPVNQGSGHLSIVEHACPF